MKSNKISSQLGQIRVTSGIKCIVARVLELCLLCGDDGTNEEDFSNKSGNCARTSNIR